MPDAKVFWAARDLDGPPWGNHQFLLITFTKDVTFPEHTTNTVGETNFITLGAFKTNGKLTFGANQKADVLSVQEVLDPKTYATGWSDFDMERHEVTPPAGDGVTFARKLIRLAANYGRNSAKNPIAYSLKDENCAAWVNSILKKAGVLQADRHKIGEFSGFDWGEEDEVPESLFND